MEGAGGGEAKGIGSRGHVCPLTRSVTSASGHAMQCYVCVTQLVRNGAVRAAKLVAPGVCAWAGAEPSPTQAQLCGGGRGLQPYLMLPPVCVCATRTRPPVTLPALTHAADKAGAGSADKAGAGKHDDRLLPVALG